MMKIDCYDAWHTIVHMKPRDEKEREALGVAKYVLNKMLDGYELVPRKTADMIIKLADELRCGNDNTI